jgi:hypothetical protein
MLFFMLGWGMSVNCDHQWAYCSSPRWHIIIESHGGMILTGKPERPREVPAPLPLHISQIPHGQTPCEPWPLRAHALTSHLLKMHFNIILPSVSTRTLSQRYVPLYFLAKICLNFSTYPKTNKGCKIPRTAHGSCEYTFQFLFVAHSVLLGNVKHFNR